MKLLHTSDWHAGRPLRRVSRIEECRAVLAEIAEISAREDVDGVLVCGDVFEHLSPSAEAEQVVYDALLRFGEEGRTVVLLAGNHDHPGRWRALAPLFSRFDIHVVDDLRPPDEGGIVEIPSRDGATVAEIVALPWVSERKLYEAATLMHGEATYTSYAGGMAGAIQELCSAFSPGRCHLLAAHIFISGSIPSGTERPLTIGEIYAITPDAIPATVQYAALGHVHKPQEAPRAGVPCVYSGSPLRLDFGQSGEEKSVVIVEVEPDKPAKFRRVALNAPRDLKTVDCRLGELKGYRESDAKTFFRVRLICDGPEPGLSDQVREILPNALIVELLSPERPPAEGVDVRSKTPLELFEGYLASRSDAPPDPALLEGFKSLLTEVSEDARREGLWSVAHAAALEAAGETTLPEREHEEGTPVAAGGNSASMPESEPLDGDGRAPVQAQLS